MATPLCDRCGEKPGTIQISSVPANRAGVIQKATEQRLCRDCARATGVRIRERRVAASDENTPPDWVALQRYYEMMARIPLADPAQRAEVAADARRTLRVLEHFPDQPPPEMRALLERMARGGA